MLPAHPIVAVLALLVGLRLALRGKPWHGAVACTLGLYVVGLILSLVSGGTSAFTFQVTDSRWWIPTACFAVLAAGTGVPGLRRLLFGRRAWRTAKEVQHPPASPASQGPWQARLLEEVSKGGPRDWDAVIDSVADVTPPTAAELYADPTSLEAAQSRAPEVATARLSAALEEPNQGDAWRQLMELQQEHGAELSPRQRASLIATAGSRSESAGFAAAHILSSGVERLIESIGTPDQRRTFLDDSRAGGSQRSEHVTGAWSGNAATEPTATVVRAEGGGEAPELALRLSGHVQNIVGANAATLFALGVKTLDPSGLTGKPLDEDGSIGSTCVLVRPPSEPTQPDGTTFAERLGSLPLYGELIVDDVVVDSAYVLGGPDGIGSAGPAMDLARAEVLLGRASTAAGSWQRVLAIKTSRAILSNVMASESIEAWDQAETGYQAFLSRALSDSAAALIERGDPSRYELASLQHAVNELTSRLASDEAPAPDTESSGSESLPAWLPTWYEQGAAAATKNERGAFDLAWARGLRELTATGARAAWLLVRRSRSGATKGELTSPQEGCAAVTRAWHAVQSAELLGPGRPAPGDAVGQALATCAWIELTHRVHGSPAIEEPLRRYAVEVQLEAALSRLRARTKRVSGWLRPALCRLTLRAASAWASGPSPELAESVAASLISHPEILRRLTQEASLAGSEAALQRGARLAAASRVPIAAVRHAQSVHQLPGNGFSEVLDLAVQRRIITRVDAAKVRSCMAAASELLSFSPRENELDDGRLTA